jgi:hypothetical protein
MIIVDTNILRFCKDNNLSDDTYQKLRYFIYCILSNPYYQTTPNNSWTHLLIFDNSEMETDKDMYYYLSYEIDHDRIFLYHSNRRGNLKLNYINIRYDVSDSVLIILQSIFPEIKINDRYQIRGEMNQKIVHHLFYLIEKYYAQNCFDVIIEKRKPLKISEKRELTTKFNSQCDCCGDFIGNLTRSSNEDHIRELQYFGTNDLSNFQLLCLDCHECKTKLNVKKKRKLEEATPKQSKRRKTNTASVP